MNIVTNFVEDQNEKNKLLKDKRKNKNFRFCLQETDALNFWKYNFSKTGYNYNVASLCYQVLRCRKRDWFSTEVPVWSK